MTGAERFLAACHRDEVDATPVWFMRQAGRCLAEYRELREKYDILTMTRTPELCAQVTMMPVDTFGVDAAVMYADIMLPLEGMGVPFAIDPGIGPIIHEPVRTAEDVAALKVIDAEEATPYLFETIRALRPELDGKTALIGFAGAPYTMASYMIEGRPTKDFARAKSLMYSEPGVWRELMVKLAEVTSRYLRAQVEAGVQVVQLFDSWVGSLGRLEYEAYVLPHTRRIFSDLRDLGVPMIHFGTGTAGLLEPMARAGADVVSVDWRLPLDAAWERIGYEHGIQGNLDPAVLLAPWPVIERESRRVLDFAGGRSGHIFNLGHGVLAETPADNLTRLVELVHEASARPVQEEAAPEPEAREPEAREPQVAVVPPPAAAAPAPEAEEESAVASEAEAEVPAPAARPWAPEPRAELEPAEPEAPPELPEKPVFERQGPSFERQEPTVEREEPAVEREEPTVEHEARSLDAPKLEAEPADEPEVSEPETSPSAPSAPSPPSRFAVELEAAAEAADELVASPETPEEPADHPSDESPGSEHPEPPRWPSDPAPPAPESPSLERRYDPDADEADNHDPDQPPPAGGPHQERLGL